MSTTDNNSNILRKDASDIFDQIRKKAEDISTSEGSNRIFHNLSNPTNLTNPQIITIRKIDNFLKSEVSKNNNPLKKVKTRNVSQKFKPDKSSSQSNRTDLTEQLLINEQIRRLILRKRQKTISDKNSESQKLSNFTQGRPLGKQIKKNKTMEPIGEEGNDLWSRLRDGRYNKKEKIVRVNKRKFITAREYISSTKNIQLMKFIRKNKIEKLNMLVNIRKSELDTLNSNLESLENNKEAILNNYNKKYVAYISYLLRQKDNEEKNFIDLIIKSGKIRKEIAQIQSKINKVQKEKMNQLNLILLFIQIKERIRELPEGAIKLFGTSDENLNKENKINKNIKKELSKRLTLKKRIISANHFQENINIINNEDLKKIMQYKGKLIYNDVFEFGYDYNQMEEKMRKKIKYSENLKNDIKELKKKLKILIENIKNDPNEEARKHLINVLNDLKFQNKELISELNSLKIKYDINNTDSNPFKSKNLMNIKKSKITQSTSATNIFHPSDTIQTFKAKTEKNFFNTIFSNNFDNIYNPKTILTFKQYFTLQNFDFNNASNLFLSCYNIYNIAKDNFFPEKDLKFDIDIKRGFSSEPEKETILKMIEYIQNVLTLLLNQKKFYLGNKKLRKKYEKIRDLLEEDKRRMNFINSFKKDEEQRKLRLKQLSLKKEKIRYIPSHKIESKYFFKTQKEKISKAINLAELKRAPTFEDFMFDVMG
jgi:hypothetical protein